MQEHYCILITEAIKLHLMYLQSRVLPQHERTVSSKLFKITRYPNKKAEW